MTIKHNFQYQETGIEWLASKKLALLADEQGLGKSRQVILAADKLQAKKILIIGPAVARLTWENEFKKWATVQRRVKVIKKRSELPLDNDNVLLVSFDYALTNFPELKKFAPDILVIDESHFLKSLVAKRTRAILSSDGIIHSAKRTWLLTGTPMPNHPGELWPMLKTFGCTQLNHEAFIRKFCLTYPFNGQLVVSGSNRKTLPELRELLNPIMLRRIKSQVLKDLPPIIADELFVEADLKELPIIDGQYDPLLAALNITEPLAQIQALELLAGSIATLRRYCVMQKINPVLEIIKEELKNQAYKKLIIFCIHKEAVDKLLEELKLYKPVSITGSVNADQRQKNIETFQNDPECRVFIGNIQAAGTNITLTAANQMIFLEQSWVPGDNAQAIARANRIGQTDCLNVRVVSIKNSIDEKVNNILFRKTCDIAGLLK